jgi:hypothetical protein
MRTIAHELRDVVAIAHEVLAFRRRALPVATPVEHHEAEPLVGERALLLPFVRPRRERAMDEHGGRPVAPGFDEEAALMHWRSPIHAADSCDAAAPGAQRAEGIGNHPPLH